MLPIYDDITFLEVLDKGGRNKPWLIRTLVNDTYEEYVLKLFQEESEAQSYLTASEIYGAVLASEFDLTTPEIALFDLSDSTIFSLPGEQLLEVEEKGKGLKFGCKYYPDSYPYTPSIHKNQIQRRVAIDTLFAFDQLINNVDRQHHKPNILYRDAGVMLIDHELGFKNLREARQRIENNNGSNASYQRHICYELLVRANSSTKKDYFDTFEELLRTLNINILDPYCAQLRQNGVPGGDFAEIKSFLEFAKGNHRLFVTTLKGLV